MTSKGEVSRLVQPVITGALDVAAAERHLPDGRAVQAVTAGETRVMLAARDLVAGVNALPPGDRPHGWDTGRGGDRG